MALSFALDDALDDAYSEAFPVLNGKYFTDGCGNNIPFKAAIAWYTANASGQDLHFNSPGYLTYNQAIELYEAGWDIMNHSYNHASNVDGIDYHQQIHENHVTFNNQTRIAMNYMVAPSGDTNYVAPALEYGYHAVFTSNIQFNGFPNGVTIAPGLMAERPVFWRFLRNSDRQHGDEMFSNLEAARAALSGNHPVWWNEFTHRVSNLDYGASMRLADFEQYFELIESHWGAEGTDEIWVAGAPEVFDYLLLTSAVSLMAERSGDQLTLTLDVTKVPQNLRHCAISLITTGNEITSVNTYPEDTKVNTSPGEYGDLINIQLPDYYFMNPSNQYELSIPRNNLELFPNPANVCTRVRISEHLPYKAYSVQILDIKGTSIRIFNNIKPGEVLNLNRDELLNLAGLYFVILYDGSKQIDSHKLLFY